MSDLRQAAQQALEALEGWWDNFPESRDLHDKVAITDLRKALEQQAEALQAMNDQLTTGTSIMLDGKRVDPASVYKKAEPVAAESITDAMMNLVDRLGSEWKQVDLRAWQHLLVYAPQQQAEPVAWEHHAKKLTHWLHCMSYNDSYFGEPAGLVKQVTAELNRLIGTALKAALEQQAEPVQEPFGYLWPTGRHPEFRFTQQKRDGADGMPLYTAQPQRKPLMDELEAAFKDGWQAAKAAHGIKEGT